MAIHQATELDLPLVDETTGEYINEWNDELGNLSRIYRINPAVKVKFGDVIGVDPETGEEIRKNEWEDEDFEQVYMYHILTEEEIAADAAGKQWQAWQDLMNRSPLRLDDVEDTQASTDEALCDLYEQLVAAQDTIQTQDDAVCELYEMILGTEA